MTLADQPLPVRRAAYVSALLRHDWQHEFSDDFRVWSRGRAERIRLEAEQRAVDPMCELWNRHAPPEFRRPAVSDSTFAVLDAAHSDASARRFEDTDEKAAVRAELVAALKGEL